MKQLWRGAGILLAVVVLLSVWMLWRMDAFVGTPAVYAGHCEKIEGAGSAEDIAIDPERALAYLSVHDRLAGVQGRQAGVGGIAVLPLNEPVSAYRVAEQLESQPALADFQPHGLSLFIDGEGQRSLLVINHRADGQDTTVERFVLDPTGQPQWRETLTSPLFAHANDLVAVDHRRFYLGTDSGATAGWQRGLERLGLVGLSKVVYFDGAQARVVVDDVYSAGGISASADARSIYVAATAARSLQVYQRGADDGLQRTRQIALPMSPDNLAVDAGGQVWVAGHPKAIALVRHFVSGGAYPAPSMAVVLDPATSIWSEVFADDGSRLPASSIALPWDSDFLVGGISPHWLLRCRQRDSEDS